MPLALDWQIAVRLLVAAALGGIVGLERELRRRPAGLRTNMLLCLGAALFTLLSEQVARRYGGDPARIASQIIPGIGFIGAGAILRERASVVGLTTAATIFVVASVGMASGAGFFGIALFASLVVLAANIVLGWAEVFFGLKTRLTTFRITTTDLQPAMRRAHDLLNQMKLAMQHFQVHHVGSDFIMEFDADVSLSQEHQLAQKLSEGGVRCEVIPQGAARE